MEIYTIGEPAALTTIPVGSLYRYCEGFYLTGAIAEQRQSLLVLTSSFVQEGFF
jgi:hypothetical protein